MNKKKDLHDSSDYDDDDDDYEATYASSSTSFEVDIDQVLCLIKAAKINVTSLWIVYWRWSLGKLIKCGIWVFLTREEGSVWLLSLGLQGDVTT